MTGYVIPGFWRQSLGKLIFLLLHYSSPNTRMKVVNTSKVRDRLIYYNDYADLLLSVLVDFSRNNSQIFWPPQHCVFPASGGTAFPTAWQTL